MCLATPGRITWVGEPSQFAIPGRIEVDALERDVDLIMIPEARPGDYVIAHSGYAIRLLPAASGQAIVEMLAHPD